MLTTQCCHGCTSAQPLLPPERHWRGEGGGGGRIAMARHFGRAVVGNVNLKIITIVQEGGGAHPRHAAQRQTSSRSSLSDEHRKMSERRSVSPSLRVHSRWGRRRALLPIRFTNRLGDSVLAGNRAIASGWDRPYCRLSPRGGRRSPVPDVLDHRAVRLRCLDGLQPRPPTHPHSPENHRGNLCGGGLAPRPPIGCF